MQTLTLGAEHQRGEIQVNDANCSTETKIWNGDHLLEKRGPDSHHPAGLDGSKTLPYLSAVFYLNPTLVLSAWIVPNLFPAIV